MRPTEFGHHVLPAPDWHRVEEARLDVAQVFFDGKPEILAANVHIARRTGSDLNLEFFADGTHEDLLQRLAAHRQRAQAFKGGAAFGKEGLIVRAIGEHVIEVAVDAFDVFHKRRQCGLIERSLARHDIVEQFLLVVGDVT